MSAVGRAVTALRCRWSGSREMKMQARELPPPFSVQRLSHVFWRGKDPSTSAAGTERHFAASSISVAFGQKQTSNRRRDGRSLVRNFRLTLTLRQTAKPHASSRDWRISASRAPTAHAEANNVSNWRICANRAGFKPPASVLRPAWAAAAGAHRQPDRLSILQHQAVAASQQHSRAQGARPVARADRPAAR